MCIVLCTFAIMVKAWVGHALELAKQRDLGEHRSDCWGVNVFDRYQLYEKRGLSFIFYRGVTCLVKEVIPS